MTETADLASRVAMIDICRRMNRSGINQGTAGNLSLRRGDSFLITPSSLPYDDMEPEDIVEMSFDGTYLGRVNSNPYDPESISNPYGQYGNPYSPNSINNPYGIYGNPYSPNSVTNPYSSSTNIWGE